MMKLVVALLCVCATVSARYHIIQPHVVGGTPAKEGKFTFAVTLRDSAGRHFCGGALIDRQYVVTAAHCIQASLLENVGIGDNDVKKQKLVPFEKKIVHPKYGTEGNKHDIGLIKLKKPVELGPKVGLISFPYPKSADDKPVTAIGWGRISAGGPTSKILLTLERSTLSNKECNKRLPGYDLGDENICLGSEKDLGMCFGDSGSPLVYREGDKTYTLGVVSWGLPCATGAPDVFTRMSTYAEWINKTMKA